MFVSFKKHVLSLIEDSSINSIMHGKYGRTAHFQQKNNTNIIEFSQTVPQFCMYIKRKKMLQIV